MSADTIRAFRKFEKAKERHDQKNKTKQVASTGLLARKTMPAKQTGDDQMAYLFNMVDKIKEYGGKANG